ncbi:MAG TPA: FKBP-type peptidyl-prolyl cis-trans isomerase [Thermoanaerobaculia bacterium]|jgi:peptidylprolyl isomerase|nr:FKBP-type peptidyl-prolyl cis-trans isomerase [Thermoanaerobaculia bacterium]
MPTAKRGDRVHVHYRGTLDDGTVFDSSDGNEPIVFTVGAGEVIPGFDIAIEGMSTGERKTEKIDADNAYGDYHDELVFQVTKDEMPPGTEIEVGDMLRVGFQDGRSAAVQVKAIEEGMVTLDANHPLAGKDLTFELELVAIE